MGKRGLPKTPTNVLAMRGSWRAKTRGTEPNAGAFVAACPEWLPPAGAACWVEAVEMLRNMGILGAADSKALAVYCQLWAVFLDCQAFLAKNGTDIPVLDEAGKTIGLTPYPQVARLLKVAEQVTRLGNQFGFTPSARASLGTTASAPADTEASRFFA